MIRTTRRSAQRARGIQFITDPQSGRTFPIPAGGSDGDDGDGEGEGGAEEESQEGSSGQGSQEEEDDEGSDSGKGDASGTVSREEYEQLKERMKAADKRATAAENKVKEFEDAEKDELTKAQDDLQAVTQERDTLLSENTSLSVQLAVVTSPEAERFVDMDAVLKFLDLDDLTDDDGEIVKGKVKESLDALAEDKPYLVRSKEGDEEDGDEQPPSGRQTNSKRKSKKGLDRATLAKKYPALRR